LSRPGNPSQAGSRGPHAKRTEPQDRPRLEVRLFGAPRFSYDGLPWLFTALPGCLPLLGLLATLDEPMSRADLAAMLWPDSDGSEGRGKLRRHLHRLHRALPPPVGEPWIIDNSQTIAWNPDAPAWFDITHFRHTIADAATRDAALALHTGVFLEGFDDEWLLSERERIYALYCDALLQGSHDARQRRDFARAAECAERLLQEDEWYEEAVCALMAARYEAGDRSAAIAVYERFCTRLALELGAKPEPETTMLRDAMVAGLSLAVPSARSLEGVDANPRDRSRVPLAGRREEIATLVRSWARAARGFGTAIFLSGEAGIGKSRLAAELAAIAEAQGGRALVGTTALPEQMPYQALIAAAQRGLPNLPRAAIPDVWLAALADVLPEVRVLRPDLVAPTELDPERARARFHEALARLFDALAHIRPLLLILEDVHWAQQDTIEALDALTRRANASPMLLLVTYRSDEVDASHPVRKVARDLQSENRATRILPAPLDATEIAALVAGAFAPQPAPATVVAEIARASEGNPLFVLQLARGYIEDEGTSNHRIPGGDVADAIMSRVARLSPEIRAVADVAATVGRDFTVDLVCDAGGWSERTVTAGLNELLARELIREAGVAGIGYTFTHATIASTIYEHTNKALRPARHRRIGKSLEAASGHDASILGTIAWHFACAGDRPEAAAAYRGAARAALAAFARSDAMRLARKAADLSVDPVARFNALRIVAAAHAGGEDIDAWRADIEEMETVSQGLGGQAAFETLQARVSFESQAGSLDLLLASARAMVASAEQSGHLGNRVIALDALGMAELQGGWADAALVNVRAALELATNLSDPERTHELRQHLIIILVRRGDVTIALDELSVARSFLDASDVRERLAIARVESVIALTIEDPALALRVGTEYLADAQQVGDLDGQAKAHALLGYGEHGRGDARTMREHFSVAAVLFERLGARHGLLMTYNNRSTFELEIGRLDKAERALTESEKLHVGARDNSAQMEENWAYLEMLRGDADRAQAHARRAVAVAVETGEARLIGEAYAILGEIEIRCGASATGFADFARGLGYMRDSGANRTFANMLCAYGEARLATGDITAAQQAAKELRAFVATREPMHPARLAAFFAHVAKAAGNSHEAEQQHAEAVALLRLRLAQLDETDAAAYRALPFIRAIADAAGYVPER